jgi:streptomycin 6-kinase
LDSLPELVKTYETKWGIKIGSPIENLSINYVQNVQAREGQAVLKIGFPEDQVFLYEIKALEVFNGNGAVRIIREDFENSVVLLESCIPGKSLDTINDEEKENLIFTNVSKRIWKRVFEDSEFPKLADEKKYFDWYFSNKKAATLLPIELVAKAKEKFEALISAQKDLYLLHGDLHHDNILSSERGWLSIDPKGIVGEREYEIASFITNPRSRFEDNNDLIDKDYFAKKIESIATILRFDKKKITQWAFVKQVLSLIWTIEDHGKADKIGLRIAIELEKLVS